MYKTIRKHADPTTELRRMFELHSEYLRLNMERQRDLITDVDTTRRSFIASELSVIESQKQTVERLIGMYTGAVFAQQSELASYKANAVAGTGVLVAIVAVILTDFRFQSLLK